MRDWRARRDRRVDFFSTLLSCEGPVREQNERGSLFSFSHFFPAARVVLPATSAWTNARVMESLPTAAIDRLLHLADSTDASARQLDDNGVKARLQRKLKERHASNSETASAPKDSSKDQRIARVAFGVTAHLLDGDALSRMGATPEGTELYAALAAECNDVSSTPSWRLSVPARSADLSIGKTRRQELAIPCGDVMYCETHRLERSADQSADDDAADDEERLTADSITTFQRLGGRHIYAVRTRVWTVDDPNRELREAHEEAHRKEQPDVSPPDSVPRFSAEPFALECSLDGYAQARPVRVCERYTTDNDPAALATEWSWHGGVDEFDLDNHLPVRATVVAAELLNNSVLRTSHCSVGELRESDPERRKHYHMEQRGVGVCLARHILGREASLPDEPVAVVHERHCIAHAIMRAPTSYGAKRLISRAFGSLRIGAGDDGTLGCRFELQHRVLVIPLWMYVNAMKALRRTAVTDSLALVPIGRVALRLPKSHDTGGERRINVVTDYVQFLECPSLLMRYGVSYIGGDWLGCVLQLGKKKYTDPAHLWHKRVNDVREFCVSLIEDGRTDEIDLDTATGRVNIDSLAELMERRLTELGHSGSK